MLEPSLAWPHQLRRGFRIIVFDWDGTAIPDRRAPAPRVVRSMDELLRMGVLCCVITGTHLGNLEEQLLSKIQTGPLGNLYLFTNRGSEVFTCDVSGCVVPVRRVLASRQQEYALDQAAVSLQQLLMRRFGLRTEVVFDRMNRRKVDLIPTSRWKDPRKEEFGELHESVQSRLLRAGINGGLRQVVQQAEAIAAAAGLKDARITSDIKHVEIGITDKADSVRWIQDSLAKRMEIADHDIVILGDEFGSVGGIRGSDSLMCEAGFKDAVYVSVGVEPEGVPEGVIHLVGGPRRFEQFLDYQIGLHRSGWSQFGNVHVPTPNPSWLLEQEGFDPTREREMESLFTLGNGRIGVRGAMEISIPSSQADLFIAGVYDRRVPDLLVPGADLIVPVASDDPHSEIVAFPSPFGFSLKVAGVPLSPATADLQGHERILDMKKGILFEILVFKDNEGRLTGVRSLRCVSYADKSLLLQEVEICCENHSSLVELDIRPAVEDFQLKYPHLIELQGDESPILHEYLARYSRVRSGYGFRLFMDGLEVGTTRFTTQVKRGESVSVRKLISVHASLEGASSGARIKAHLGSKGSDDFQKEVRKHTEAWERERGRHDVRFPDQPALSQAQRFAIYHLRISADRDTQLSVPARALTGRAYEGHVFWDAEIFVLPFFLQGDPLTARSMMLYRFNTLDEARRRARQFGLLGAFYPWESAATGRDVTPAAMILASTTAENGDRFVPVVNGEQQIHITADVAYGVWKYWEASHDEEFMIEAGTEVLVETARFWASRVTRDGNRYRLLRVVGPDEYHPNVNDNAYTNWMARFNLRKAAWACEWLSSAFPRQWAKLAARLRVETFEPPQWTKIASMLYFPEPDARGVLEQFDGFFQLKPSQRASSALTAPPLATSVDRMFYWDEIARERLLKQADVLMIPFLFPDELDTDLLRANYDYYEPITDHGSSLSPPVHAALAARIGRLEESRGYWEQALNLDLKNLMRNTALGIHIACMGGSWQALVGHIARNSGPKSSGSPSDDFMELPWGGTVEIGPPWRGGRMKP